MHHFKQYLIDFYHDEEGLTTVEYAIAGALVALGVVAAFTTLGTEVKKSITDLGTKLKTANDSVS